MVTALSLDLGRWMWWPGRLARRREPEVPAAEYEIPSVQAGQVGR
jgi:RND superfamily putative drug exporter